jgi:hypothetical protein
MEWNSWTFSDDKARSMLGYRPQVNVLDWLDKKLEGQAV